MITTVPPKMRWKCAVTHEVLWTMAFMPKLMLMSPPPPPNHSMKKARPVASTIGRSQGSAAIQPNRPRPPRSRPAISIEAVDGEDREQRRRGDERREAHLQELEGDGLLRIHEQVVHADRQAVDQEQDEGEPPHRVASRAARRPPAAPWCRRRCRPGSARNRRWRAASTRTACATVRHRGRGSSRRRPG